MKEVGRISVLCGFCLGDCTLPPDKDKVYDEIDHSTIEEIKETIFWLLSDLYEIKHVFEDDAYEGRI